MIWNSLDKYRYVYIHVENNYNREDTMSSIALFMPAVISVEVWHRRNKGIEWKWYDYIKEYAIALLINTFLAQAVITYLLGLDGVDITAFSTFPFFTKYVAIATVLAVLVPYIREIIGKYFSISFEVGDKSNEKK